LFPILQRHVGGAAAFTGSTWSNVGGLDINIDNLSLAGKQRGSNAPSMNQLASGSSIPQPVLGHLGSPVYGAAPVSAMPFGAPMGMAGGVPPMMNHPHQRPPNMAVPFAGMSTTMMGATPTGLVSPNRTTSPTFHSAFGK
jgi:hypothetical protein